MHVWLGEKSVMNAAPAGNKGTDGEIVSTQRHEKFVKMMMVAKLAKKLKNAVKSLRETF